jgi:hypothetical protein
LPPTVVIPVMLVILIVVYAAYRPRPAVAPPRAVHGAAAGPGGALDGHWVADAQGGRWSGPAAAGAEG